MTKFTFRLESALRLRQMLAEKEFNKLHELLGQKNKLEQLLASVGEERLDAWKFVQNSDGPPNADFRALSSFCLSLSARVKTISEALSQVNRLIAEQNRRLVRAKQDERSVSKLRENRLAQWHLQAEREIESTAQELWLFSHTTKTEDPNRH